MISKEEYMIVALQFPQLAGYSIEYVNTVINDYKEWLIEDTDWLEERGGDPNTLEFLDLYFECITEDENFIREQMVDWEDDDVPGFR